MRALAATFALCFLVLAGCSDSGDDGASQTTGPGGSSSATTTANAATKEATLAVAAAGAYPVNPSFSPSTAAVPANAVIHTTFTNGDLLPIQHNWVVAGITGAASDTIGSGEQSTFDFTTPATPGEYTFYCAIGDHRERGMEGTLTVTA